MQEKSNTYSIEQRQTAMDSISSYIWKHSDWVVSVGVALVIITLFQTTCVISLLL